MRTMFGRLRSDDELFSRRISLNDMERIRDGWTEKCEAANLRLGKAVNKELTKRVKGCSTADGGKPKLELKNCELDDKQVKFLMVNLAVTPVIAKLDLRGNSITNKTVEMIIKLLKGQTDLVKRIDVDSRIDATFLTDVSVSGQSSTINPELEEQVNNLTTCLKWGNAEAHVRKEFWKLGAPDEMDAAFLENIVKALIGKVTPLAREYMDNVIKRSVDGTLVYSEVERCCLKCLVFIKTTLPELTKAQEGVINKSIADPVMGTSMPIKEGEEEDDDEPVGAGAGTSSGSTNKQTKKDQNQSSNKSNDSSSGKVRPAAGSKAAQSGGSKRDFIKENAIKVSTIHNLHPNHAAALHGPGHKGDRDSVDNADLEPLKRGGSGDVFDHSSNHGSPSAAGGKGAHMAISSSSVAVRGESERHGGITHAGTLHFKDAIGSENSQAARVKATNLASQPKLSSQQRSSGYAKLIGSPTGAARKQREIEILQSAALPQSPEASPVIMAPPPGAIQELVSKRSSAQTGAGDGSRSNAQARKTMYIQQNIQHIKELQNALKLEAQTGIPAKKLMATSMPTAGNRAARARAASTNALPTKLEPILSSAITKGHADAEKEQRLTFGAKDSLKNSHVEGTGWRGATSHAIEDEVDTTHFSAAAKAAAMMDDPIPSVSSPEQGDDEESSGSEEEEEEEEDEQVEGDDAGSSEEKGIDPNDDEAGGAGAKGDAEGSEVGRKKKTKKKKGRSKHRMTMMEDLVPGAYRPGVAAKAKAAAQAEKDKAEEEEARAAREAAEREKIVVLDFANSHMEALDLRSISQLSNTPRAFENILVLILRGNKLFDLADLRLSSLVNLTDLDLGSNKFLGAVPEDCIPGSVERLDLSYNQITDISNLFTCTKLKQLTVKNNAIKKLDAVPMDLETLDISFNQLSNILAIRMLSLSKKLKDISLVGNPIVHLHADIKSIVLSVLPSVVVIDGVKQSGNRIRKTENRGLQRSKAEDNGTIYMKRSNHSYPPGTEEGKLYVQAAGKGSGSLVMTESTRIHTEAAARLRAQRKKEKEERERRLQVYQKPSSRKTQIEKDRKRTQKLIAKQETYEEIQKEKEAALVREQKRHTKVISEDDQSALIKRLTSTTRRDPAFHQKFIQTKSGRISSSPPRSGRDYLSARPGSAITASAGAGSSSGSGSTVSGSRPGSHMNLEEYGDEQAAIAAASELVRNWINECTVELGRASAVVAMIFSVTKGKGNIDIKSLSAFRRGVQKISFVESMALPASVEDALGVLPPKHSLLDQVASVLERMALCSNLLIDMEDMVAETARDSRVVAEGGHVNLVDFKKSVDGLMDSSTGQQVHEKVLVPQGCGYWYSSTSNYYQAKAAETEKAVKAAANANANATGGGDGGGATTSSTRKHHSTKHNTYTNVNDPKLSPLSGDVGTLMSKASKHHSGSHSHHTHHTHHSPKKTHSTTERPASIASAKKVVAQKDSAGVVKAKVDGVRDRLAARALKKMGDRGTPSPLSVLSAGGSTGETSVPVVALNLASPLEALNQSRSASANPSAVKPSRSPLAQDTTHAAVLDPPLMPTTLHDSAASLTDIATLAVDDTELSGYENLAPVALDSVELAEATKELSADVEKLLVPDEERGGKASAPSSAAASPAFATTASAPTNEFAEPETSGAGSGDAGGAADPAEVSMAHAYDDAGVDSTDIFTASPAGRASASAPAPAPEVDPFGFAPSPSKGASTAAPVSSTDPFSSFSPSSGGDAFEPTTVSGAFDPFAPSPPAAGAAAKGVSDPFGFAPTTTGPPAAPVAASASAPSDDFFASAGGAVPAPAPAAAPAVAGAAGAADGDDGDGMTAKERIRARIEAMKKKKGAS